MFEIDSFIEIQVVGVLLLLGLSPLFLLMDPAFSKQQGAFSFIRKIDNKGIIAILVLIAAFCVGVAGNRLVDDSLDALGLEGEEHYSLRYSKIVSGTELPKSIKLAEFKVAGENPYARGYLERHKSFMRVLRGAFFACLLFLGCMLAYRVGQWRRPESVKPRYSVGHFAITLFLLSLFFGAYISESTHYYRRVCELTTQVPKCQPLRGPSAIKALAETSRHLEASRAPVP